MVYGKHDCPRPIPLVWDKKQIRNERMRFSLVAVLTIAALGLLTVEAFDTQTMLGYVATLWDATLHWLTTAAAR